MRFFILCLFASMTSCSLLSNRGSNLPLAYDNAFKLKIGLSSEKDVVALFGKPDDRKDKDGYYTLEYYDPNTGFQRMSLNFENSNLLSSILWIPFENEREASLDGATSRFHNANFKKVERNTSNPHMVSKMFLYADEAIGIKISYSPQGFVQGIAKYNPAKSDSTFSKQ